MCSTQGKAVATGACSALIVAVLFLLAACAERLSQDDFAAAVKDKSTTEVVERLGDPDSVDESIAGTIRWIYTSRTFSVGESTKLDSRAVVVFRRTDPNAPAKVTEVLFE